MNDTSIIIQQKRCDWFEALFLRHYPFVNGKVSKGCYNGDCVYGYVGGNLHYRQHRNNKARKWESQTLMNTAREANLIILTEKSFFWS